MWPAEQPPRRLGQQTESIVEFQLTCLRSFARSSRHCLEDRSVAARIGACSALAESYCLLAVSTAQPRRDEGGCCRTPARAFRNSVGDQQWRSEKSRVKWLGSLKPTATITSLIDIVESYRRARARSRDGDHEDTALATARCSYGTDARSGTGTGSPVSQASASRSGRAISFCMSRECSADAPVHT